MQGPLPADTAFFRAVRGDFDLVVAMYHDQGHGPIKVLGLDEGVNVTVGLPVIRTSVDHGTAFDIAGQGVADPGSLRAALREAVRLAGAKRVHARRVSDWDVIVVGAGNAGLCAAHAARERGCRVLVLEKADRGVVGRQLRLHRRRDPASRTAASTTCATSSRADDELAARPTSTRTPRTTSSPTCAA